jgi:ribosomal protein S1
MLQMDTLSVGAIVDATITRLEQYGAWIDCGGRPGLVTIPEVSWSRIGHPAEVLSVGQRVRVKVMVLGSDGKLSASIRALHPEQDPWRDPAVFAVGEEFAGRVVRVLGYGCFVELRPEVWGLLRREHWSREVAVGGRVRVRVVSVDPMARKVEVLEMAENPPEGY